MKGYKAFNKDLTCRNMQYEIGKEYTFDGKPIPCVQGFHFCKSIADCYKFYAMSEDIRICEIIASGDIKTDDEIKYCTNKIKIVREIKNPREKTNTSTSSSGYCNTGDCNSGNSNTGYRNKGNYNTGARNIGNRNAGDLNTGNWNSGNRNTGDWNTGDFNSGSCNTGNWNSGYRNTGDWNAGGWNAGIFNTIRHPKIKIFDKESDWTIDDWMESKARRIMSVCPGSYYEFIRSDTMTDKEKRDHPEFKIIGGYIKGITVTDEDKQIWWDSLPLDNRREIYKLPNFNAEKFKMCTGITVDESEVEE